MADEIKFGGPPDALVWKMRRDDISLGTKLVVTDSQEAIFFNGSESLDVFTAGTHTLNADNMPMLVKFFKILTGRNKIFGSEIYFVNKTARLDNKWGTKSPFSVEDPQYKVLISVGCFGQFGLKINDSRLFITEISGTSPELRNDVIIDYFRGLILTRVQDTIAKYMVDLNISVGSIIARLDDISKITQERLNDEFERYGLELLGFQIASIRVPDEELERLRKGSFDRLEIDQIGSENYQLKRSFDLMETAAKNPTPASLFGGASGQNIGAQMAELMSQIDSSGSQDTAQPAEKNEIPELPGALPSKENIQLDAGRTACRKCKNLVQEGAQFCNTCGESLLDPPCASCGNKLVDGSAFCSMCGAKVEPSGAQNMATMCRSCGNQLEDGTLFCPTCGSSVAQESS